VDSLVRIVQIPTGMLMFFALWLGLGSGRAPNACQVLSKRDVAAVQGARFKSTKLTETAKKDVQVSQCFYAMPRLSDSVSVDLIRGDTHGFWKKHFDGAREEQLASTKPRPEREAHAMRVGGIGDAAVWSGNRIAGALYVLKADTIVRVSVGGVSQEQKIEKAKQLAARALRRL
jgi:hypothetical protein